MNTIKHLIDEGLSQSDRGTPDIDVGLFVGAVDSAHKPQESDELHSALFENSFDLICLLDFDGRIMDVNPGMLKTLGYRREEMLTFDLLSLVEDQHKHPLKKLLQGIKEGRGQKDVHEFSLINKAGTYISLEYTASILHRGQKSPAIVLIARDVSELRKLNLTLQKSEQKFVNIAEESMDMIFIATEEKLLYVNQAAQNLLGYSVNELTSPGFSLVGIVAPEYKTLVKKIFHNIASEGEYPAQEIDFIHRNSKKVNTITRLKLTRYGEEHAVFGVISDTSAIRSAQQEKFETAAKLIKAITAIIDAIASTMQLKDPYTFSHQQRVTTLAVAIAGELNLSAHYIEGIRLGAMVHDIGKTYIPTQILSKPPPLNAIEFDLIKMHPKAGYDILKKVDFPWPIPEIALQHHERLDGSGYPSGLMGSGILFEARIVAVADVVEAMSAHRPYRPGLGVDKALVEIIENKGRLYDEKVVEACCNLFYQKGYVLS